MFSKVQFLTRKKWGWLTMLLFLLALLPLRMVLAHGGGELEVGNAPIGSYLVSIWVNPPTVQAGQVIHVTVGIAQESTGEPVLDAGVDVLILDDQEEVVATAVATTEQSINRLFYEADLDVLPTGAYAMQVTVTGSGGRGDLAFPLEVMPRSILPWVGGGLVGLLLIGLIVRGWRRGGNESIPRRKTAVPRRRAVD
jgi:hypothetical protein